MEDAERGTKLKDDVRPQQAPIPAEEQRPGGDARSDQQQLRKNQQDLGVGNDHKTPDMEEKQRGTFP